MYKKALQLSNFYCYLSIESKSRLGKFQSIDPEQPLKLNIVSRAENRKRLVRKVVNLQTKEIIKCTPDVFRACWPEYSKDKTVLQDAKMLAVRGKHREMMQTVNDFKKQWEDIIHEANTTNKNNILFLFEIEREIKSLNSNPHPFQQRNEYKQHNLSKVFLGYLVHKKYKKSSENGYIDAINSYLAFSGDKTSIFKITPNKLKSWVEWHREKNNSWKTIESYNIRLKAVLNYAVKTYDLYNEDRLPFGKKEDGKFQIPRATTSVNLYLNQEQIEIFKSYECKSDKEQKAKDLWFMMYYLAGCYPVDLIYSFNKRNYNSSKRSLSYERSKSIDRVTVKKAVPIQLETDDANSLVQKYTILTGASEQNLFPFHRTYGNNPIINFRKRTNKYLKQINQSLGFENLLCAMARHSCFNKLKSEGISISEIMEIAGHTSLRTTQLYLDTLVQARLKDAYSKL